MELIIVTGMSGAGKSKTMDALEDIGYFCVDNIPPQMLGRFAELGEMSEGRIDRVAVAVDARGREMFRDFLTSLDGLDARCQPYRVLFLDASDETLLRRYKEGRRRHPLLDGTILTLEDAVRFERELLRGARQRADYVIDTSNLSVAQLKETIVETFLADARQAMLVHCMSFGFKNGLPRDADLVFDVRCLPNPFYEPELRALSGLDEPVGEYIMRFPQSRQLLDKLFDLIDFLIPLYAEEGKSRLVVAIGCTGGRHRSVFFTRELCNHLAAKGERVVVNHRDMQKPNSH